MTVMQKVNSDLIKEFAKTLEGKFLFTKSQKKQFLVNSLEDATEFIPQSSGIARREPDKNLERVIKHFNDTLNKSLFGAFATLVPILLTKHRFLSNNKTCLPTKLGTKYHLI